MNKHEELIQGLMLADESISRRTASRTATIMLRHGVNGVSEIPSIDVAEAVDWYNCGEKMVELFIKLGAHGEVPEKPTPIERRKLKCPSCGAAMEPGSRVSVTLKWEGTRLSRFGHAEATSKSTTICRKCARAMCEEHGLGGVVELVHEKVE